MHFQHLCDVLSFVIMLHSIKKSHFPFFCHFNKIYVALFYFTDIPGAFQPSGMELYYKIPSLLKNRKLLACNSSSEGSVCNRSPHAFFVFGVFCLFAHLRRKRTDVLKEQIDVLPTDEAV